MKYKIIKNYNGDIELKYGYSVVVLTEINPTIILSSDEYMSIPETKISLFKNKFLLVEEIDDIVKREITKEEIIDKIKEDKKFTKK